MTDLSEKDSFQYCRKVTVESGTNFFWAIATLPPEKRRAVYAVYAFARKCDDIADSDKETEEKRKLLGDIEKELDQIEDSSYSPEDELYRATSEVISEYDIPVDHYLELVAGVKMDLDTRRYPTFEDLRLYCYRVASVVGLILIEIFDYRTSKARSHAIDLGIGMQLTNIIRDIREDLERDRIYLPEEDLKRFNYSERELKDGAVNSDFRALMDFQADRAREYFKSGKKLFPLLPRRARSCPAGLYGIYNRLLNRMESSNWDILGEKKDLTTKERLFAVSKQWVKALMA